MNRPFDLVLFDAVGTLIEPNPPVVAIYQQIAAEFGGEISNLDLAARFGRTMTNAALRRPEDGNTHEAAEVAFWRGVVGEVLQEVPQEHAEAAFERLWQHFAQAKHWRLFADVLPTLTELRRRGYRLGIASNFDERLVGICKNLPPLDQMDDLFVSSRLGWVKPAAGFYLEVQRATQIDPARILMVGDDFENDVVAAQRHGWQARYLVRDSAMKTARQIASLTKLLGELP